MKRNVWKAAAIGSALCATLSVGTANAVDLVANGGFESGSFSSWVTTAAPSGTFFGVDSLGPHVGGYSAFFGALGPGVDTISQTLATTAGQQYALTFLLDRGVGSSTTASFTASLNGVQVFAATGGAYTFAPISVIVTASSGSSVLAFSSYNASDFYTLDNVSVNAVPEPGALVLMAIGVTLLVVRRRT